MVKKALRKPWNKTEINELEKYIKSNSLILKSNFYKNIYLGKMKFRRCPRFFIRMSSKVGRSPSQCKSKFQKFEKEIYTDFLELPLNHLLVYQAIRKNKPLTLIQGRTSKRLSKKMKKKPKFKRHSLLQISKSNINELINEIDEHVDVKDQDQKSEDFKIKSFKLKEINENKDKNDKNKVKEIDYNKLRFEIIQKINNEEIDIIFTKEGKNLNSYI